MKTSSEALTQLRNLDERLGFKKGAGKERGKLIRALNTKDFKTYFEEGVVCPKTN